MNIALWVVQILVALAYLLAGIPKATQPVQQLGKRMSWVKVFPLPFVRFVGIVEVLGAIGLILPLATGILPWLTIAAAIGFVVVQIGAAIYHASHGEARGLPINIVLLLLALVVVVGRIAFVPIA